MIPKKELKKTIELQNTKKKRKRQKTKKENEITYTHTNHTMEKRTSIGTTNLRNSETI